MTSSHVRPLQLAMATALMFAIGMPAAANAEQESSQGMSMKEKRAQRLADIKGESQEKQDNKRKPVNDEQKPALYPNATRIAPDARATPKLTKPLQGLQELYEKRDMAGVMATADEIASMPNANNYDKSYVYSLAANAASDLDDKAKSEDYFSKAIESNGLDNDSHFNTMFNLAVVQ